MTGPLDVWWRHPVTVERYTGRGAYGAQYAAPVTLMAAIDDRNQRVLNGSGQEVTAATTVLLPIETAAVALESRVTLPAAFSGRRLTVISVSRHDSGGQPTPDHLELSCQ